MPDAGLSFATPLFQRDLPFCAMVYFAPLPCRLFDTGPDIR